MSKEKPVSALFEKYASAIITNLASAEKHEDKGIHDLRVNIKHFRAITEVCFKINKDLPIVKTNQLLRPLFKSAGQFRSNRINIDLLTSNKLDGDYLKLLRKKDKLLKKKLKEALAGFKKNAFKKNCRAYKHLLDKTDVGKINTVCIKHISSIKNKSKKKLNPNILDSGLHEMRKELKSIRTTLQLIMHFNPSKLINNNLRKTLEAENCIGEWHDSALFYELLLEFANLNYKNNKIMPLIVKIRAKNAVAKNNVLHDLTNYFN